MICVVTLLLPALVAAVEKPTPMLLHSAYTPFTKEDTLDVSGIPRLAKQAKAFGVNTVFVGGSMAEFDTMSIDERKTLMDAWLAAARDNELYTIVNVGTTVIADAPVSGGPSEELSNSSGRPNLSASVISASAVGPPRTAPEASSSFMGPGHNSLCLGHI